jgi:hypothetical protein
VPNHPNAARRASEAVVIGGGLGLAGDLHWNAFLDAVRRHI